MEHKISVMRAGGAITTPQNAKELGWEPKDIVGIVLQTPVVGIVISLDSWDEIWGETDNRIWNERGEYTGDSINLMDLSGRDLTKRILDAQSDFEEMTAAKRCAEYKKGNLEWYLPSAYELCTICAYRTEINQAMNVVGFGDCRLSDNYHWSSSEIISISAVTVNFDSGTLTYNGKSYSGSVRAVSAFEPLSSFNPSHCEHSEQCAFDSSVLPGITDEEIKEELRNRGYSGELTKVLKV